MTAMHYLGNSAHRTPLMPRWWPESTPGWRILAPAPARQTACQRTAGRR